MAKRKSIEKMSEAELIARAAELRAQRAAIKAEQIGIDRERARREHAALAERKAGRSQALTPAGVESGEEFGKLGDG